MPDKLRQFTVTAAALVVCIFITHWFHELGHAVAAKNLGYDVLLSSNQVVPLGGGYASEYHHNIVSLAGPLVTVVIAVSAFLFRARLGFIAPIILWNTMTMRVLAALASIGHPNDEARASLSLGLGTWTIPLIVCGFLLLLFGLVARERKLGLVWYLGAWLGMSAGYSLVILGEDILPQFVL